MYLEYETEEEVKHGDSDDQEVKYEEMLVEKGLLGETSEQAAAKAAKKAIEMVMIICSCGSPKCFAINRFGLPKPVFHENIEPIWDQMSRDLTALRIKQLG